MTEPVPTQPDLFAQLAERIFDVLDEQQRVREVLPVHTGSDVAAVADAVLAIVEPVLAGHRAELAEMVEASQAWALDVQESRRRQMVAEQELAREHASRQDWAAEVMRLEVELELLRDGHTLAVQMVKNCVGHPDTGSMPHSEQIGLLRAEVAHRSGVTLKLQREHEMLQADADTARLKLMELVGGDWTVPPSLETLAAYAARFFQQEQSENATLQADLDRTRSELVHAMGGTSVDVIPDDAVAQLEARINDCAAAGHDAEGITEEIMPLVRSWLAPSATDPQPQANSKLNQNLAEQEWGVRLSGGVTRLQSSESAAREYVAWHNAVATGPNLVELVQRSVPEWRPVPVDEPATPTLVHEVKIEHVWRDAFATWCPTCETGIVGPQERAEDWADQHTADSLRPAARAWREGDAVLWYDEDGTEREATVHRAPLVTIKDSASGAVIEAWHDDLADPAQVRDDPSLTALRAELQQDAQPRVVGVWRDETQRLWVEHEGDLMSLTCAPNDDLRRVDSSIAHSQFELIQEWAAPNWREAYEMKLADFARETLRVSRMLQACERSAVPRRVVGEAGLGYEYAQDVIRKAAQDPVAPQASSTPTLKEN